MRSNDFQLSTHFYGHSYRPADYILNSIINGNKKILHNLRLSSDKTHQH